MAYEDIYSSTEQAKLEAEEQRDTAMATLEESYPEVQQAELVSDRITDLIDPHSEYMQTAKAESREAREES